LLLLQGRLIYLKIAKIIEELPSISRAACFPDEEKTTNGQMARTESGAGKLQGS
jgi:hypothetical protein